MSVWKKLKFLVYSVLEPAVGYLTTLHFKLPAGNSPNLDVSHHHEVIQISMQLTSHAGLAQVLSYPMFMLVLSLTYPQRDGGLSQPPARMSQEWVLNPGLLHEGLLLYQLSYPGQ